MGGQPASPGEFPYQVSIQAYDRASRDFIPICGGVILNPTTVLSAAHCTLVDPDGLYRVVAGEHDLSSDNEGTEQFRTVEHVVREQKLVMMQMGKLISMISSLKLLTTILTCSANERFRR